MMNPIARSTRLPPNANALNSSRSFFTTGILPPATAPNADPESRSPRCLRYVPVRGGLAVFVSSGRLRAVPRWRLVQLRMLTARAPTTAMVANEASDCAAMIALACRVRGSTSVGLKAIELVSDRYM